MIQKHIQFQIRQLFLSAIQGAYTEEYLNYIQKFNECINGEASLDELESELIRND